MTPTQELAGQIDEVARGCARFTGQRIAAVYGGVGYSPQADRLRRGVELLVATPGRLLDLHGQGDVNLSQVRLLVLDAAAGKEGAVDLADEPVAERKTPAQAGKSVLQSGHIIGQWRSGLISIAGCGGSGAGTKARTCSPPTVVISNRPVIPRCTQASSPQKR